MTNKIIIDAWNVCWKIPDIASLIPDNLQNARKKFNQLVKNYLINKNIKVKIIYDGQPNILNDNYLQKKDYIHFSKNPETADSFIINFIQKQSDKNKWTVITSDQDLAKKVRLYDTKVISSEEFITKLKRKKNAKSEISYKDNPELRNDEINYWLNIFSDDKMK